MQMFKVVEDRSKKGKDLRDVFVESLQELMKKDSAVVALEADLGGASHFTRIAKTNPDRFVQCGISEANMMGVAAGMSSVGFKPYTHTFGPFATRRAFDQIYLSGAYAQNTLNIWGSDPGFCAGGNGGTHTTWEDVALMRTIPGSVVVDAADETQLRWVVSKFSELEGIHYVRANRKPVRNVYAEGSTFQLGRGNVVRQGDDVLIICAGQILSDALDGAEALEAQGITCEVVDMFTIKPLDEELILSEAAGKKAVVTFENHNVTGGLGSAVAECLLEHGVQTKFKRLGVTEEFGQVGTQEFLQKEFGLCAEDLQDAIIQLLNK